MPRGARCSSHPNIVPRRRLRQRDRSDVRSLAVPVVPQIKGASFEAGRHDAPVGNCSEETMRKKIAMTLISLFTLTAAASALTACNTARGVGEDVSAAGHAVTGTTTRR